MSLLCLAISCMYFVWKVQLNVQAITAWIHKYNLESRILRRWFDKKSKPSISTSPSKPFCIKFYKTFFYNTEYKSHLAASVCICVYIRISVLYKNTGIKIYSAKVGPQFGSMWKDCTKLMVSREQNSALTVLSGKFQICCLCRRLTPTGPKSTVLH